MYPTTKRGSKYEEKRMQHRRPDTMGFRTYLGDNNGNNDDDRNLCKKRPDLCMLTCESYPQLPVACNHYPTLHTGYNEYLQNMYEDDNCFATGGSSYSKWNDARVIDNSDGSNSTNGRTDMINNAHSSNSTNTTTNINHKTVPMITLYDDDDKNDDIRKKNIPNTTEKVLTMDDLLPPVN